MHIVYLKGINFHVDLISRGQQNRNLRGFNFANQHFLNFLRKFIFASQICSDKFQI